MSKEQKGLALVTGANKGIGLAIAENLAAKGFAVVLTSRNEEKGKEAVRRLSTKGDDFLYQKLDVTDEADLASVKAFLENRPQPLEVIINNAGIMEDGKAGILDAGIDTLENTFRTNTLGPLRLCQNLVPLMLKERFGRIVNVSSGMGQLQEMGGGSTAYRISKAALNAVTRILHSELSDSGILVNSMCPGWVKTDMGGQNAPRTPEKAAETAGWLATLPPDGPSGKFFRDCREIPW